MLAERADDQLGPAARQWHGKIWHGETLKPFRWCNAWVLNPCSLGEPALQLRKMTELEQRMTDDFDWAQRAPAVQQNPEHYGSSWSSMTSAFWRLAEIAKPSWNKPPSKRAFPRSTSWW
jgi:hypothetical protein